MPVLALGVASFCAGPSGVMLVAPFKNEGLICATFAEAYNRETALATRHVADIVSRLDRSTHQTRTAA